MGINISLSSGSTAADANPASKKPRSSVAKGALKKPLYEEIEGCRIAYEAFIHDIPKILKGLPKTAEMSIELAKRYGATMVIGTPENLEALSKVAPKMTVEEPWRSKIGEGAARWVETLKVGCSSAFMLYTFTGFNAMAWMDREDPKKRPSGIDYPRDPDDMTRCRRLLDAAPEFMAMMPKLSKKSPHWKILVEHWDAICACMDKETPDWRTARGGRAPETYNMMRELQGRPRVAPRPIMDFKAPVTPKASPAVKKRAPKPA